MSESEKLERGRVCAGLKREVGDLDWVSVWLMFYDWYDLLSTADREVAIESKRA